MTDRERILRYLQAADNALLSAQDRAGRTGLAWEIIDVRKPLVRLIRDFPQRP